MAHQSRTGGLSGHRAYPQSSNRDRQLSLFTRPREPTCHDRLALVLWRHVITRVTNLAAIGVFAHACARWSRHDVHFFGNCEPSHGARARKALVFGSAGLNRRLGAPYPVQGRKPTSSGGTKCVRQSLSSGLSVLSLLHRRPRPRQPQISLSQTRTSSRRHGVAGGASIRIRGDTVSPTGMHIMDIRIGAPTTGITTITTGNAIRS